MYVPFVVTLSFTDQQPSLLSWLICETLSDGPVGEEVLDGATTTWVPPQKEPQTKTSENGEVVFGAHYRCCSGDSLISTSAR